MVFRAPATPSEQALRVIGVTVVAWGIRLPSAHAVARRAPHGWVPLRTARRLAAATPPFAHSW